MEPFYQLQRSNGALAADSLCLRYRSSINVVSTLSAIRNGNFIVLWSGPLCLFVLFLAPLASEAVFIGFVGKGRCVATSASRSECIPRLSVLRVAARVLQGVLAFVACLTLFLAIALARQKSGVFANPLSLAGLATLFQHQGVIDDFRPMNSYSPEEIATASVHTPKWTALHHTA